MTTERQLGLAINNNFDNTQLTLNSRLASANDGDVDFFSGDINKLVELINPVIELASASQVPALPISKITDLQTSLDAKLNLSGGTMSGALILNADPTNTLGAVTKQYADALVVGLLDDRGSYDASGNVWPSTGGSGTAGAILKGDLWTVSVAGTLGGNAVGVGDWFRALVDSPGQTASNWGVVNANIGYVPENVNNKSTSATLGTSDTLYPTQNAVKTYVDNAISSSIPNLVKKSANYTVSLTDEIILCDTTSGSITITLLDTTAPTGKSWCVGDYVANATNAQIIVNAASGGLVFNAGLSTSYSINQNLQQCRFTWDGTKFTVTDGYVGQGNVGDLLIAGANGVPAFGNGTGTQFYFTNTTQSTNASSGALIISGGVGIAKNLSVDGNLNLAGNINTATWNGVAIGVTKGGTGLTTIAANRLLYASATDTIAALASANDGVLITSGAGVPSISSTLPSAVQGNITALGTITSGLTLGSATLNTSRGGSFIQKQVSANTALTITVTWASSHSSGDSYIFLKLIRYAADGSANCRAIEQDCLIYTINSGPTISNIVDVVNTVAGAGITINACTLSATTATSATIQSTVASGTMHTFAVQVLSTPNRIGTITLS
jgi:hypothetical protein